jgi:hypothetical protein
MAFTLAPAARAVALGLGTLISVAAAHAAMPDAPADSGRARFEKERADCLAGRTHQDRATCLREATNAYDEARKRPTAPADEATLQRNALQRCTQVKPEDQADCRRLAMGQGMRSGSVEGGGVVKEIVTVVPGKPATAP